MEKAALYALPDTDLDYHTPEASGTGAGCVSVAHRDGLVFVKDADFPQAGRQVYTTHEWDCLRKAFLANEAAIVGPNL